LNRVKAKEPFHSDYEIADVFMIRAPLLSLDVLREILESNHPDEILQKYYSTSIISEALFLASPELYRLTEKWLANNDLLDQAPIKFKQALLKYLLRMSSRCTPFGLFAGITSGSFGPVTDLSISPVRDHKLQLRPDMQYLCTMASSLIHDQDIREKLKYYPNTSLSIIGDEYRFIEYFTDKDGIRKYQLQKTANTSELQEILQEAQKGKLMSELSDTISGNGVALKTAQEYIRALIENQVLISSLEPVVSGGSYLDDLLDRLDNLEINHEVEGQLRTMDSLIRKLGDNEPGARIEILNDIIETAYRSGYKAGESSLIQADLKLSFTHSELSDSIREDLVKALPGFMKLSRPQKPFLLENFKDSFQRRYQSREIPLMLALDAEAGPGYLEEDRSSNASPLLNGLLISGIKEIEEKIIWGDADRYLHRKLQLALLSGDEVVHILDEELAELSEPAIEPPLSFSVMTRIHGAIEGDPARNLIQIDSVGGSSAANLAGRFCYLDERLDESVKEITKLEQEIMGEAILAEIIHLPQQRTGNILMRPVFREYEIPYLTRAAVDSEKRIALDDLMISVKDDKVYLRSKRLDKYIIPRLSNAHNFSMASLPVYRFLCDLQFQGVCPNLGFSWGGLNRDSLFLPRVMYKNMILHPSTWNLPNKEFSKFTSAKNTEERKNSIRELRDNFKMPEEVAFCEGDNELWINLEDDHCLSLLQNEIKGQKQLVFHEYLYRQAKPILRGDEGAFANECVFFMHRKKHLYE